MNDLWRFDTQLHQWEQLPSAEGVKVRISNCIHLRSLDIFGHCSMWKWKLLQARGGAGLAVSAATQSLYVIAGFCGEEMQDVHKFDLQSSSWDCPACCSRDNRGLSARSVFGTATHSCAACVHSNHIVL